MARRSKPNKHVVRVVEAVSLPTETRAPKQSQSAPAARTAPLYPSYGQQNGAFGQGPRTPIQTGGLANKAGVYRPIPTWNQNGPARPGVRTRPQAPGQNLMGTNTLPVDAIMALQGGGFATTFPPGDPVLPTPGMGDGQGGPRAWPYPAGVNIVPQPRATEDVGFTTLRNLAALYEGIQLCEQVYFRIVDRLELQFVPKPSLLKPGESASDDKWKQPALAMQEWMMDGPDRRMDLHGWMKALLRDILELDAGAIYHRPTREQGLYAMELVAGETIACLLDLGGRTPLPPYPAYQQVVYGVPGNWYTSDQMDYLRMTARTESPYGRSIVERIILRVNQALRKENYDLTRFTDGATPEGVIQTQNAELAQQFTIEEAQAWEEAWNAVLAGNDAMRHRTKLVPPGFTFQALRSDNIATDFDRYLMNVTVAAFGLTMDEVAMTENSNRSVGQSQENVTYRNAVKPVTDFIARYLSGVVRRYDGTSLAPREQTISRPKSATKPRLGKWDGRYLVSWGGIEEPEDFTAKANAYVQLVDAGIVGRTEAKRLLKLPVSPDEEAVPPMITAQGGVQSVVIIEDMLKQRDQMLEASQTQLDTQIQTQQAQQEQIKQQAEQQKQLGGLPPEAQQAAQAVTEAKQKGHNVQITTQPTANVTALPAGAPNMAALQPGAKTLPPPKAGTKAGVVQSPQAGGKAGAAPGKAPANGANGKGTAKRDEGRGLVERSRIGTPEPLSGDGGDWPRPVGGARTDADRHDGGASGTQPRRAASGERTGDERATERRSESGAGAGERASVGAGAAASGGVFGVFRAVSSGSGGVERATSATIYSSDENDVSLVSEEWARWYDRATRAAKRGQAQPPFTSALLPLPLAAWVGEQLAALPLPDVSAVRAIFREAKDREQTPVQRASEAVTAPEPVNPSPEPSPDNNPYLALLAELRATRALVTAALVEQP